MEIALYNVEAGFLDGIVRGYRSGLLTNGQYINLTQCDTLEDLKLQLASTDYGNFLQNVSGPLTTSVIAAKCTEKFVEEFKFLRFHAYKPLAQLLDYITYGYMIDNVILIITGTLNERDTHELLDKCHPLGRFEAMAALCLASNVSDLFQTVLVETPLAPYFANCLSAHDLDEMNIEIIRNTLYKAYLYDFYEFSQGLDEESALTLGDFLKYEADRHALNVTINSFGTELTKDDRSKLYPKFGHLYPEGTARLARADDIDQVRLICESFPAYKKLFEAGGDFDKSLDDRILEYEVYLNKNSFEENFNYAVFYAYVRLKEQEIRNIVWISECISQRQKERINNYVPTF